MFSLSSSNSRRMKKFTFLENRVVASRRDIDARAEMKRRGYRIDTDGPAPTPTREELRQEYQAKGMRVIFSAPVNGYNGRNAKNRHQYIGIYIKSP